MSLSAKMKQQFFKAAEAALDDPNLQHRPVIHIEAETFRQILKPIERMMRNDPIYNQQDISIASQVEELRRMCLEAQTAHTTKDTCTKKRRSRLLNALQGILETIQETENA